MQKISYSKALADILNARPGDFEQLVQEVARKFNRGILQVKRDVFRRKLPQEQLIAAS